MKPLLTFIAICFATSSAFAAEPDGKKYLVIHADDAGMSHSVNRATIDSMKDGVVSSASIMVPCPWFKEFAKMAKENPTLDYGIHLTLNSEWKNYRWGPVAPSDQVPSLIDEEGYLWGNVRSVALNAKADEVAIELRAQINRALEFGVPLSHLDTHMGAVISRPDLLEVYVNLASEFNLPVLMLREFDEKKKREYPALVLERAGKLAKKLEDGGFPLLDRLAQFYEGDTYEERHARYVETLRNLQPGFNQLIIHCGYADDELRAITSSAERRDGDRRVFMDPQIAKMIESLDIEVVTWKQLSEMTAPAE
ncbi:MAG: ChbG/HpnK family deacetylase [Planctomycetes bacterium]|nr:ChbG/HpnK family deacetylase [Planctomycetota bacterium]